LINKIALGTAQFGLNYGINNTAGQIAPEQAQTILDYAYNNNIDTIDTASAYGNSETVLGNYFKNSKNKFKIITKLNSSDNPENFVNDSFIKLNQKQIYAFLIHNFSIFRTNPYTYEILQNLKNNKQISKIGFSLYYPNEIDFLLENNIEFDILQVPYSIFDQRFSTYFEILKEKNVEIHVRSIFLQGLFFKDHNNLTPHFSTIKNNLKTIQNLCKELKVSIASLCQNFALLNQNIDKVVIGIDNLEQLKENINIINDHKIIKENYNLLKTLKIEDENILLPFNWGTK
jgi:uncharacterized protein